jgi:hypothetical protein
MERFQPEALRALPIIPYDHRDTVEALVHKDLRLQFDGNKYCVPHRYVGQRLTVKAHSSSVTIYERVNEVVSYPRSWRRGQTFGAERFEKVLAEERPAARRSQAQQRLLDSLDGLCSRSLVEAYLRDMADSDRSLARQIGEIGFIPQHSNLPHPGHHQGRSRIHQGSVAGRWNGLPDLQETLGNLHGSGGSAETSQALPA